MEILAPAGSPEGLVAAIKGGCDAVYLGGSAFGARAFAKNFTDQELEGAIEYAHSKGVRVHVTVNTLIKNSEMEDAVSYVRFLSDIGADAVIIQDLGLLSRISDVPIEKHASTQMGIHSAEGLKWCSENGISRAILSRELTFEELETLVPSSPIDAEVFVQGAMCYGFSGGCLFSSIVGGRSGNRGECAQPCRKKYESDEKSGFLLSNADMFCIDYLEKLEKIGVKSVKIEGRMRSSAYAYLASKAYSMANRNETGEEFDETVSLLKTVFNRGFCHGYLDGTDGLVHSEYPDNRGQFLGEAVSRNRKVDLSCVPVNQGDGISLFSGDEKVGGFKVFGTGKVTAPFDLPNGKYQVYRTYDPRIDDVKNLIGKPPEFTGKKKRPRVKIKMPLRERPEGKGELSFYVSSPAVAKAVAPYADRIYYDGKDYAEAMEACEDAEFVAMLPRFQPFDADVPEGVPVMAHGPGQVRACHGRKIYGSYSLNMFNSLFPMRLEQTTLSVELSRDEMRDLLSRYKGKTEVMVFGRTELLVTRDPELPNGYLTDSKGYVFPVYRDPWGMARIINSSDTMLIDFLGDLKRMGVDSFGIDLRKRPTALASKVAKAFRDGDGSSKDALAAMSGGKFNTGHYRRGV